MKRRFHGLNVAGVAWLVSILTGTGVVAQGKPDKASSNKTAATPEQEKSGDRDAGLEIVELSGKLQMIFGNQAKLAAEDGKETVVMLSNDTTFEYTGTAEPSLLSPGLMIRFTASFDAHGNPQAPLAELEVFRPAKVKRMSRELIQSQTMGVYPVKEKRNKERGTKEKQPAAAPAAAVAGVQAYQVVARLTGIQADRIQIAAGGRPMVLQVDPALKVNVSSGDAFFCRPGDDVQLTGLKNPAGLIAVETMEVTGAKPLGQLDDKQGEASKANRPNARTKANDKTTEAKAGSPKDKTSPQGSTKPK